MEIPLGDTALPEAWPSCLAKLPGQAALASMVDREADAGVKKGPSEAQAKGESVPVEADDEEGWRRF